MKLHSFVRAGLIGALGLGLAACVDADIEVLSENTARMQMVLYTPNDGSNPTGDDYCDAEGAVFSSDADYFKCTVSAEGTFDDLAAASEDSDTAPTFTPAGPGLVRVELPMGDGNMEAMPPEAVAAFAEQIGDKPMVVTIRGPEIVESNMEIAGDRRSAVFTLDMVEALRGAVEVPPALYAVVKVN